MNKKAQAGTLAFIILIIMFLVMWALFLGGWVSQIGVQAVQDNNITGVEAFFLSNLNIIIFIGVVIGTMGFLYLRSA